MAIKLEINLTNKLLYSLIFVVVLLVFSISVAAYNSGSSPDIMGHSGEEIDLGFTQVSVDCSLNNSATCCVATCSGTDTAVSGYCLSFWGENWDSFGISVDQKSWTCCDSSFVKDSAYEARVLCKKN